MPERIVTGLGPQPWQVSANDQLQAAAQRRGQIMQDMMVRAMIAKNANDTTLQTMGTEQARAQHQSEQLAQGYASSENLANINNTGLNYRSDAANHAPNVLADASIRNSDRTWDAGAAARAAEDIRQQGLGAGYGRKNRNANLVDDAVWGGLTAGAPAAAPAVPTPQSTTPNGSSIQGYGGAPSMAQAQGLLPTAQPSNALGLNPTELHALRLGAARQSLDLGADPVDALTLEALKAQIAADPSRAPDYINAYKNGTPAPTKETDIIGDAGREADVQSAANEFGTNDTSTFKSEPGEKEVQMLVAKRDQLANSYKVQHPGVGDAQARQKANIVIDAALKPYLAHFGAGWVRTARQALGLAPGDVAAPAGQPAYNGPRLGL